MLSRRVAVGEIRIGLSIKGKNHLQTFRPQTDQFANVDQANIG